jgi:hypothetical protein
MNECDFSADKNNINAVPYHITFMFIRCNKAEMLGEPLLYSSF